MKIWDNLNEILKANNIQVYYNEISKDVEIDGLDVSNGDFLKDDTGNRRYWVIHVEKIDFNIIDNLDINMLWGEVMHLKED